MRELPQAVMAQPRKLKDEAREGRAAVEAVAVVVVLRARLDKAERDGRQVVPSAA